MKAKWRTRGWFGKCLFGAALGVNLPGVPLYAQELSPIPVLPLAVSTQAPTAPGMVIARDLATANAGASFSFSESAPICDPCTPGWCDPISRVPNFLGDFFARGSQACTNTLTSQTLTFTGGGEGNMTGANTMIVDPFAATLVVNGPRGPYTLFTDITGAGGPPTFVANQNAELTALILANFPGATFVNGTITYNGNFGDLATFVFNYLATSGRNVCVNLPNPSGGGLVGRNKYFDNGSPLPRDRAYFFYNHVSDYNGLGTGFQINRYVFGVEKTILGDHASIEVRVPFAGTASSDQSADQPLAVNHAEFGNVGVVFKGALYRTPNFLVSAGMGASLPTADDSRLLLGGRSVIEIRNRALLLQPLAGVAWAPNERFYAQAGLQFDIDPTGNPVLFRDGTGNLSRAGTLSDRGYVYGSGAAGYWIYQNAASTVSGVALQGELHYNRSLGTADSVRSGNVVVTDLGSRIDVLNATTGVNVRVGERANLSVGVSFPVSGDRQYDWNLMAQINWQFGPR